jgi:hypothetical protein
VTVYVYFSDLDEHEGLAEEHNRFTDLCPSRPSLADRQVALVSFDHESIGACARMTRSRRKAASYKWLVTFDEFVFLDDPVSFDDLAPAVGQRIANALQRARRDRGRQLDDNATGEVLDALKTLRPEVEPDLDRLVAISAPRDRRPRTEEAEPVVEYERDAVGLALDLAGLRDERVEVLSAWDGSTAEPFLTRIEQFRVYEDAAIHHDSRVFGGWKALEPAVVGMTRFERRGRRVTVINVNRTSIERTLGVDLIYYTTTFNSYVLVQYKRMQHADGDADERWHFRPDNQFDEELVRMRTLIEERAKDVNPNRIPIGRTVLLLEALPLDHAAAVLARPDQRDLHPACILGFPRTRRRAAWTAWRDASDIRERRALPDHRHVCLAREVGMGRLARCHDGPDQRGDTAGARGQAIAGPRSRLRR